MQESRSCADGTFGVWGNPNKHRKARFPIFRKTGFSYLYIQMPRPVTGSSIWISRCPACRDSGQKRFARLYIQMHCLPGLSSNDSDCRDKHCLSAFAQQTIARGAIRSSAQRNLPSANRIRSECQTSTARPYVQNNDLILQRHHIIVQTPPRD